MTKCFKMVLLQALLQAGAMREGLPLAELADGSARVLRRNPILARDVEPPALLAADDLARRRFAAYWKDNPVKAWCSGTSARWFSVDGDRFVCRVDDGGHPDVLAALMRELIDLRLSEYRTRRATDDSGEAFTCKVTWNQRDPILKLPRADRRPVEPGWLDATVDGAPWRFKIAKEFCNVARPVSGVRNELPDLLRGWFGPGAGRPGTAFAVRFQRSPEGWFVEPEGAVARDVDDANEPQALRGVLVQAFPDLAAAAGAAREALAVVETGQVRLPVASGDGVFAVRARGDSMNGGSDPIRDGDWLVFRFARGASAESLKGRRVLVEVRDADGSGYLVKRLAQDGRRWVLRSDNAAVGDVPADERTVPIAVLVERVAPEGLAPGVGEVIAEGEIAGAFGVSEAPRLAEGDASEGGSGGVRVDGHLFLLVRGDAVLGQERDRVRVPVGGRRPGETGFVLLRRGAGDAGWKYLGVARWDEAAGTWVIAEVPSAGEPS